jgi:hypothetical protein
MGVLHAIQRAVNGISDRGARVASRLHTLGVCRGRLRGAAVLSPSV